MNEATVYTDGSCWPNPGGPGGFGAVIICNGQRREISCGFIASTNNRMELMGVIGALCTFSNPHNVKLYSDSQYVVNGMKWAKGWANRGWRTKEGKPVKNKDLWQVLLGMLNYHQTEAIWVRGHDGNEENEVCDHLAGTAAKGNSLMEDKGYQDNRK